MSDNKNLNELEFDDEIDFDGLEDFNEEETEPVLVEDIAETEENNSELIAEENSDDYSDEAAEQLSEDESEASVDDIDTEDVVVNITETVTNEIDIENLSFNHICDDTGNNEEEKDKSSDISVNRFVVVNTAISAVTLCAVAAGIICGYGYINSIEDELQIKTAEIAALEKENRELEDDYLQVMNTVDEEEFVESETAETERGKIIFYDTSVGYSWAPVLEGIKQNEYKKENFSIDDRGRISYIEENESSSYFGIDVSSYQGDIDWQLVKEDGVEFAFLRIGYRGYGEEGKLCADENFADNYAAAHDAGLDLGIYFFSQAVNADEAIEEANYVLSLLEGRALEYPIVFDWETVQTGDPEDIPRTEDVMPNTLTLSAIAFCETIRDAGYDAMIYTNKKLATIKYDLRQLQDYPIWLAYYDTNLDYRYDFDIWQYGTGQVDGIEGEVDINIAMIK